MAESMFNNLYDIETIQNQNADTSAMNVAKLEPGRATVYGAGVAGNMLSKGFNQALGRQTAQEQKAAAINDIMKRNANLDPADPNSQLALKKEFLEYNMPDIAMAFDDKYRTMIAAIPAKVPEKFGTIELQSTNKQGQNVTEMWQTGGNGKIIGDKPIASQVTSEQPSFDDEINEAVLEGYIATETKKLMDENAAPMNNATRLSQDEIVATGIANGKREYNKVENAPAAGSQSAFSERLSVWDTSTPERRQELTEAGFFDGDAMQLTIENAINSTGENAYAKKIGELSAEQDLKLMESISPAMRTLTNTNEVFKLLDDDGVTTGIGATYITNVKRIGNQVVELFGKDVQRDDVSKDQYLEALLGSQVFAMIKTLGIGARGLDTPAERDFLISVMTGTRTMDKEAIKRLTRLRQEIAAEAVDKYNEKINNGSLDNYIILNRNLKDDGSDAFKTKLAQAKIDMIQTKPEMYQGTWDRPVEGVSPILLNNAETGYHTWDGRYYDTENREVTMDDLNRLLMQPGGS